jgi:hypothetical protein
MVPDTRLISVQILLITKESTNTSQRWLHLPFLSPRVQVRLRSPKYHKLFLLSLQSSVFHLAVSLVYRVQDIVLSEIFGEVERSKARYGIRNWALSQSSLDDVFVRIVKEDEHLEDEIPAPPSSGI